MKRFAVLLIAIMLTLSAPALAGIKGRGDLVTEANTVSTAGGAESFLLNNVGTTFAYLTTVTSEEVGTASLVITVYNVTPQGDVLLCTSSAVTTETTTAILLGSSVTAASDVDQVCTLPLSRRVKVTFTVTGTTASFDVDSGIEWLGN